MCDDWFALIKLPLTIEQFHQLPRNAAYKYEYLKGEAWLTPRPKHYHALRELKPPTEAPSVPSTSSKIRSPPCRARGISSKP